jgi:ComF family protein
MGLIGTWINTMLPGRTAGAAEALAAGWSPDRAGAYCPRCGASAAAEGVTVTGCAHCRGKPVAWHGVWRLGAYKEPLAEWIRRYKFRGAWAWGEYFGSQLSRAAREVKLEGDAVVTPVPLHWRRRMGRGYNQSELIARAFAAEMNLPISPLLRHLRQTLEQSHIHDHAQRWKNVRQAFALRRVDLTGVTVWLVDDVKTTGSTARACARLLKAAGARRVNVAVAAVADPRGADFQRN